MTPGRLASCVLVLLAAAPATVAAPQSEDHAERTVAFVESHRTPDGGYGAPGHPLSEERWTSWAVRSLVRLGRRPPDERALRHALEAFRPAGRAAAEKELARRRAARTLGWITKPAWCPPSPLEPPPLTAWSGSPPLTRLAALVLTADPRLLDRERGRLLSHLALWRGRDGGWGYPVALRAAARSLLRPYAAEPPEIDPDHPSTMEATITALRLREALEAPLTAAERTAAKRWILRRQTPSGGFAAHARAPRPDLYSTALALEAAPRLAFDRSAADRAAAWIGRLRHVRGGFAFAADEPPSLEATCLALEALAGREDAVEERSPAVAGSLPPPAIEDGLELHQALIEAGPSPAVALATAQRIGARLVLLKGPREHELARRARAIIAARGLPLAAACGREEYRRAWGERGVGYTTHGSDVFYDPEAEIGDRGWHETFAGIVAAWRPARRAGALIASCSFESRELLAPVYDAAARGGEAYDLLAATDAFSRGGDLLDDFPWLHRYAGRLPLFGNHDAHDDPYYWPHLGLRCRTLFFARTHDLDGFRDAVRANRTVAVAHRGPHAILYGHPHWVERARARRKEWDRGRPAPGERAEPPPMIIPIDDASREELPALREGYAVVVRAAASLWDDAFPSEVTCRVDGEVVALQMIPLMRPPITYPALWAPLPGLTRGSHRLEVEAFGRRTSERASFGDPVARPAARPPAAAEPPLSALTFRRLEEIGYAYSFPSPEVAPGRLRLRTRRVDFILEAPASASLLLEVGCEGGPAGDSAWVFVNGIEVGRLKMGRVSRRARMTVPPRARRAGLSWISVRRDIPPWIPRVAPPVGDDFALTGVAFRAAPGAGR